MDSRVVDRTRQAESMSAVDLIIVQQERARMIADTTARLADGLVAFPTTPHVAMPIAPLQQDDATFFRANMQTLRNTTLGNFLDWCGISIPSGVDADGMPTGFLLSAPHAQDSALLSAALTVEPLVRG